MPESQPQHTAKSPQYQGRPRIWTDPETNNVVIGTYDGEAVFSVHPRHADAVASVFNAALAHATAQREQAIFLHKLHREQAVAEFRKEYLMSNSGRDVSFSEVEKEVRYFSDDYDREHGYNPFEIN